MKKNLFLLLSWLLLLPWSCFAQNQDWLEITAQDREMKEVPDDPGASAVQLFLPIIAMMLSDTSSFIIALRY